MVFTGKPSTGCERCRERRKKCDETRPQCLNCIRIGKPCPGFPDPLNLLFKHESGMSSQRGLRSSGSTTSPDEASSSRSIAALRWPIDTTGPSDLDRPSSTISTVGYEDLSREADMRWTDPWKPHADQSTRLSATSGEGSASLASPRSKFAMSRSPDFDASSDRPPLELSTEALCLRSINNIFAFDRYTHTADLLYDTALGSTRQIKKFVSSTNIDECVLIFQFLMVYECLRSRDLRIWTKSTHPDSTSRSSLATSSDDLRTTNFIRPIEAQQLRDTIAHYERSNRTASSGVDDRGDAQKLSTYMLERSLHLPAILGKAHLLFSGEDSAKFTSIEQVEELLQQAYDLENGLFQCDMNMTADYAQKSYQDAKIGMEDEKDEVGFWPGSVHVYQSVHTCSVRNYFRVIQLICCNVVIEALKWLDLEGHMDDGRYKAAVYKMQYLVDDIAASVPYHLGYRPVEYASTVEQKTEWRKIGKDIKGELFLVWPLSVCSQMPCIEDGQRGWFVDQLRAVTKRCGLAEE